MAKSPYKMFPSNLVLSISWVYHLHLNSAISKGYISTFLGQILKKKAPMLQSKEYMYY